MIKGLQLAGPNPTSAAVIKDLRGVKSYNVNGLLAVNIDYSTIFGHDPAPSRALVHAGQAKRFRPRLDHTLLRDGHPGDLHRQLVSRPTRRRSTPLR